MQNKNFDGLDKNNIKKIKRPLIHRAKVFRVDSIIRQPKVVHQKAAVISYNTTRYFVPAQAQTSARFDVIKNLFGQQRVPVLVAVVALFLAFGGGVWATLSTSKSSAEQPQVLGASTNEPALANNQNYIVPLSAAGKVETINSVPNDVLFNMSINQVENYLANAATTPELQEAKLLADRKEKLKKYLQEKNSPLVDIVNTLAELKHWQMVLAISNSESSLGKRCYNNNCSGIGVEPGNPLWRDYKSKAEWAKDLDKLLEKRYKDWSLEEMNGVYNKPGSENWLLASKQILEDLQERNIE